MRYHSLSWNAASLIVATMALSLSGCLQFSANIIRAIVGDERPAEYAGFIEQRVAIVCTSGSSAENSSVSTLLTRYIQAAFKENIKKIEFVDQDDVERYIGSNGGQTIDFYELGKQVKATRVLNIDVTGLTLRDGPTLFRGQCDLDVTVYDITQKGMIVYTKQFPEFAYPREGGTIADTTEAKFRNRYLAVVARKVSGLFYPVDPTSDVALDATANSF
jgi:hypothetical protein